MIYQTLACLKLTMLSFQGTRVNCFRRRLFFERITVGKELPCPQAPAPGPGLRQLAAQAANGH